MEFDPLSQPDAPDPQEKRTTDSRGHQQKYQQERQSPVTQSIRPQELAITETLPSEIQPVLSSVDPPNGVPSETSSEPAIASRSDQASESTARWLTGPRGLLLGLGLGIAIAGIGMRLLSPTGQSTSPAPAAQTPAAGQSVSTEVLKLTSVDQTFPAQGNAEARNWVSVIPKATGVQIQEVLVEEGQRVEAGQTIAVLDSALQKDRLDQSTAQVASAQAKIAAAETQLESARSQLQSARAGVDQKKAQFAQQKATLAEAESNLRRYQNLANQGVISRQDLEARSTATVTAKEALNVAQANISSADADVGRAQAGISQAQAGLIQAKADYQNAIARTQETKTQLDQATLVQAPAKGVIAKKNVKVGDLTGTTPLFAIVQDGAIELQAQVPEALLPKVRSGAVAQITSDADPKLQLSGRVREINPTVDEKTRQAMVKIDLPETASLKPGMFLKAAIAFETNQAITIDSQAVISQPDGRSLVYVVDGDVVRSRVVQLRDPHQGRFVVQEGLKPGEQIVVSGAGFLHDGDRVTVVQ